MFDRALHRLAPAWTPGKPVPWYVRWLPVVVIGVLIDASLLLSGAWGEVGLPGVFGGLTVRISLFVLLAMACRWISAHRCG
jgi:F0F1-type ATP synthase assembly protein I